MRADGGLSPGGVAQRYSAKAERSAARALTPQVRSSRDISEIPALATTACTHT